MKGQEKVVVFGIALLLLSSVIATSMAFLPTYVEAKKKSKPSSGEGDSNSGSSSDKGSSEKVSPEQDTNGKEKTSKSEPESETKPTVTPETIQKATEGIPPEQVGHSPDGKAYVPERGWVDGKWTGGTDEMFKKGPNGDGKIPSGCTPGGCKPQQPPKEPQPPTLIQNEIINILIKYTGHHGGSGGGGSSSTTTYVKLTPEQYEMMKLAWIHGIKRGQYPEMDKVIDTAMGLPPITPAVR